MKYSIDARGANLYKGSGIGTYIENLLYSMLKLDTSNSYTVFWAGDNYENLKEKNSKIVLTSKKHGMFYENYYYPEYIKKNNIDLHHVPQNGIGLTPQYTTPSIVTIHDLIPYIMPETVGPGYLERFLKDMPNIINQTKAILTVSEYSKKDVLKFFPKFPSDKIFVTPLAANKNYIPLNRKFCVDYLKYKFQIEGPYILYFGGFSKRKNVKELVLAFNKISSSLKKNYKLLLCGSLRDEGLKIKELCSQLDTSEKIIFPGFIDDKDVPIFYNCADLFVYPSLYEGFGLPPLEAMSCKTAVITSNLTSLPEVTGDNAILIDPFDKDQLATEMLSVLNSASKLMEYEERGYTQSLNFTWEKTAALTLNVYHTVASSFSK